MLTVGDHFPSFNVTGVVSIDQETAFQEYSESTFQNQWKIYFFWPKDFTFVCPTEISEFGALNKDFKDRDTQLFGVSTDSEFVHLAWKQHHPMLRTLSFPMLSDLSRRLTNDLGIADAATGVAKRAVFIVDTHNVIRFAMVTDMKVGRNAKEVLRVLDALQTDELCPCNWQPGEPTLTV